MSCSLIFSSLYNAPWPPSLWAAPQLPGPGELDFVVKDSVLKCENFVVQLQSILELGKLRLRLRNFLVPIMCKRSGLFSRRGQLHSFGMALTRICCKVCHVCYSSNRFIRTCFNAHIDEFLGITQIMCSLASAMFAIGACSSATSEVAWPGSSYRCY